MSSLLRYSANAYSTVEIYYMDKKKKLVHEESCGHLKGFQNKIYLGNFSDSADAIEVGKNIFSETRKCPDCIGD